MFGNKYPGTPTNSLPCCEHTHRVPSSVRRYSCNPKQTAGNRDLFWSLSYHLYLLVSFQEPLEAFLTSRSLAGPQPLPDWSVATKPQWMLDQRRPPSLLHHLLVVSHTKTSRCIFSLLVAKKMHLQTPIALRKAAASSSECWHEHQTSDLRARIGGQKANRSIQLASWVLIVIRMT